MRYKIQRKIGIQFYCDTCGIVKEQGDSLRDMKYVINQDGEIKLYEPFEDEELHGIFKELDESLFHEKDKQREEEAE